MSGELGKASRNRRHAPQQRRRSPPLTDLAEWLSVPISKFVNDGSPALTSSESRPMGIIDWDRWVQAQLEYRLWRRDGHWATLVANMAAARALDAYVTANIESNSSIKECIIRLLIADALARAGGYRNSPVPISSRKHSTTTAIRQSERLPNKTTLINIVDLAFAKYDFDELFRARQPETSCVEDLPVDNPVRIVASEFERISKLAADEQGTRDSPRKLFSAVTTLTLSLQEYLKDLHWVPWYEVLPPLPFETTDSLARAARAFCNGVPQLDASWLLGNVMDCHPPAIHEWLVKMLDASHANRWINLLHACATEASVRHVPLSSVREEAIKAVFSTLLLSIAFKKGFRKIPSDLSEHISDLSISQCDLAPRHLCFGDLFDIAAEILTLKQFTLQSSDLSSLSQRARGSQLGGETEEHLCSLISKVRRVLQVMNFHNSYVSSQRDWGLNISRLKTVYAQAAPTTEATKPQQECMFQYAFGCAITDFLRPDSVSRPYEMMQMCKPMRTAPENDLFLHLCSVSESNSALACRLLDQYLGFTPEHRREYLSSGSKNFYPLSYLRRLSTYEQLLRRSEAWGWSVERQKLIREKLNRLWESEHYAGDTHVGYFTERGVRRLEDLERIGISEAISTHGVFLTDDQFASSRVLCRRPKDTPTGIDKLVRSLNLGNYDAACDLAGTIKGAILSPVPEYSIAEALNALRKASEKSATAALQLGRLLLEGAPGLPPNRGEAVHAYERIVFNRNALDNQRGQACNNLGVIYLEGSKAVPKDFRKAAIFFNVALAFGEEGAASNIAKLFGERGKLKEGARYYVMHCEGNEGLGVKGQRVPFVGVKGETGYGEPLGYDETECSLPLLQEKVPDLLEAFDNCGEELLQHIEAHDYNWYGSS